MFSQFSLQKMHALIEDAMTIQQFVLIKLSFSVEIGHIAKTNYSFLHTANIRAPRRSALFVGETSASTTWRKQQNYKKQIYSCFFKTKQLKMQSSLTRLLKW